MPRTFEEDIQGYADGGITHVEVWLTKLEQHLEQFSPEQTKELLQKREMELVAGSYQGGLLLSQGEQRKAHFDHFRKRLNLCEYFGISTMVLAPDFVDRIDQISLQRALVSLKEAAQWAAGSKVTLALEFRGTERFCSCLPTALALVQQCGEENVGICLDVFHYYVGASKLEDLDLLPVEKLAHVHVSDMLGIPRELATDADRILPGDGELRLGPLFEKLRQIGYEGHVSLELMNPTIWELPASSVAEIGLASVQRLLDGNV